MTCEVAVTFEFALNPSITWRGEISGGGPQTIVQRAVSEAKRAYPRLQWTSLVVVILGRTGDENADE